MAGLICGKANICNSFFLAYVEEGLKFKNIINVKVFFPLLKEITKIKSFKVFLDIIVKVSSVSWGRKSEKHNNTVTELTSFAKITMCVSFSQLKSEARFSRNQSSAFWIPMPSRLLGPQPRRIGSLGINAGCSGFSERFIVGVDNDPDETDAPVEIKNGISVLAFDEKSCDDSVATFVLDELNDVVVFSFSTLTVLVG